jgi:2-phospho-L-lactate guanylyltransferase
LRWWSIEPLLPLAERPADGVLVVGEPSVYACPCGAPGRSGRGPNAAVAAGLAALASRGADGALVIAGDLPLLRAADLEELARAGQSAGLAIAPDRHGTGTNARTSAALADVAILRSR